MNLKELKERVETIIANLKDNAKYPKENNLVDYKAKLNVIEGESATETFMKALAKDCISYANGQGGILLLGLKEIKATGAIEDVGLEQDNINLFEKIDLDALTKRFKKITGISFAIDIQPFTMSVRHYAYVLIPKSSDVLVPKSNFLTYGIKAGEITYRKASTNLHANKDSADFNTFVQIKANEKSKEFMEIWSKLLPQIFDINPRDILIVNPRQNTVYGYNAVGNSLSAGPVDIEQSEDGVVSIVLNTISAGEIGKLTDNEGKPLYKIMGQVYHDRAKLNMTNLEIVIKEKANYRCYGNHLKSIMHHLGWVSNPTFRIQNPPEGTVNEVFSNFLWVETINDIPKRTKIRFSPTGVSDLVDAINNPELHLTLFGKALPQISKPVVASESNASAKPSAAGKAAELAALREEKTAVKKLKQKTTKN